MEMVRVHCPPESGAVCRQDGGGPNRYQGESGGWLTLAILLLYSTPVDFKSNDSSYIFFFFHFTISPPPRPHLLSLQVSPASCHTLFRISSTADCRSGERLVLSRYLGDSHSFHHLITTQVRPASLKIYRK